MTVNTAIQWTDHTWNPWMGCERVSPGCDHCYMFDGMKRFGRNPDVVQRTKTTFNAPLKWKEPARVFTCSWSDFFHVDADPWRDEAWEIIRQTPHLTYQILTKRPARIARHLPSDWGEGYPNVWLGTTVENQEWADRRIRVLIDVPARVRFLSVEPLIGPLTFRWAAWSPLNGQRVDRNEYDGFRDLIHWVIVGGESGPKARPFDVCWARDIINQCKTAGVACFVKQLGRVPFDSLFAWKAVDREYTPTTKHAVMLGRLALTDSHGGDMSEWPDDLRVRQFPPNAVTNPERL